MGWIYKKSHTAGEQNYNYADTTSTEPTNNECYTADDIDRETCVRVISERNCEDDMNWNTQKECEQNIRIQNTFQRNRLSFTPPII